MVTLETDTKFTRPGMILLMTGVVALLLRLVVRSAPLVGGLLGFVLLFGGIFCAVGGIVLLIKKRS